MLAGALMAVIALFARGIWLLHAYTSGNGAFPPPLSETEEAEMLERKESGDEQARNVLVERNLRLVAHVVKKYDIAGEDVDDLISIGAIGLIKAVNTFDRTKRTRLATYAARCIENEILMHLRSGRRNRGELSLNDPIGSDREGNEIVLMDVLTQEGDSVDEAVEQRLEQQRLLDRLRVLSARERRVIEMRFGVGSAVRVTQREISKALGISRSYVSRIEKRALAKLEREMSR
ncbi:MAG: RNA polymerase sigma-28 factor precursor [Firmicutes bacterium ADurb.Bin506]|nr:MAG: RNA polymerase sigma-28 factor precursor [Firmicutes bacterium ADurb.Bin506]